MEAPYITGKIQPCGLPDEESLIRIEQGAGRIMAETGIEFRNDPETVRLFRDAGGKVTEDAASAWNSKFEPVLIRSLLKTSPSQFTRHARNPAKSVQIGGDTTVFAPACGSPFVMEWIWTRGGVTAPCRISRTS